MIASPRRLGGRVLRRVRTDSLSWTLSSYGLAILYAVILIFPLYFVVIHAELATS